MRYLLEGSVRKAARRAAKRRSADARLAGLDPKAELPA